MSQLNVAAAPKTTHTSKADRIIYWIATAWLSLGMLSTGIVQLLRARQGTGGADMLTHLGYPVYLITLLGVSKTLGVIAMLIPKFPILKEWAYAGFFFLMVGAIFSHIAVGDPVNQIFPALLLLVLTCASWYFRPANRRIVIGNQ